MRDLMALKDFILPGHGHYCNRDEGGIFVFKRPSGNDLRVIATAGTVPGSEGWDHVSVSLLDRCPTWDEMDHIKRLFFNDDETAMQLHVPPTKHISCHPNCLHLWRPVGKKRLTAKGIEVPELIPVPNPALVGGIREEEQPKLSAHKRAVLHSGDLKEIAKWFHGKNFDEQTIEVAMHKMRAILFLDFEGTLSKEWLLSRGYNLEIGYMQEGAAA